MFSVFRSLRWRLQSWHALILIVVITVFGSMLRWEMALAHWDRVDEELLGAARILEGSLRAVPPKILEAMAQDVVSSPGPRQRPPMNPNRPRRPDERSRPPFRSPSVLPSRSLPLRQWKFPGVEEIDLGDRTEEEWEASIQLPSQLPEQLGRGEGPAYFFIWRSDGSILKENSSPNRPPTPSERILQSLERDRYARQQRGPYREVFIPGPRETLICVGRSTVHEQGKVARMTWIMIASGVSVLVVGLIGGSWLSKRAIEPIQRMSQTAQGISASSLSERIPLSGFDTELAGLGSTLNTMLDRLSQSFEQQRQFTADASHELRTPVSVILTSSELALSKPRDAEAYREQLEKCQRAAQRMRQLTDSLLTLARLDTNSKVEMSNLHLTDLLREAVAAIEPLGIEKAIQIQMELEPIDYVGNELLLRQAVDNLITNSIKYNRPRSRVFVRLKRCKTRVVIEVQDEGIGIPESAIPKLFDRFYRVDESRSRNEGGTGLGLSIAQRIVECHGGTITVSSELGKGTTFRIEL